VPTTKCGTAQGMSSTEISAGRQRRANGPPTTGTNTKNQLHSVTIGVNRSRLLSGNRCESITGHPTGRSLGLPQKCRIPKANVIAADEFKLIQLGIP
jgi:hypothetical protein